MKLKHSFLFIITCALVFTFEHSFLLAEAMGAPDDCPEGIISYWHLDETATGSYTDAIGTNNGACTECPGPLAGTVNGGQGFPGDKTITVDAAAGFNWSAAQSFTIEVWMSRATGTTGNPEVFVGRTEGSLNWYIGINASGQATALLQATDGSGPGALTGSRDLRSDPADAKWHHVALVRDAGTTTLYVDGVAENTQSFTYTAGFESATAPVTIGSLGGASFFANGALDEVAVYGQALDAKTIMTHYYVTRGYCDYYDTPVKITPMGNSITLGIYTDDTTPPDDQKKSYRMDLADLFKIQDYQFDFVGSENQDGLGVTPPFDVDHAGFSGIDSTELQVLLDTGENTRETRQVTPGPYLASFPTEVILLHVGTNDVDRNSSASIAGVEGILDEIDEFDKNITVVLARIINQSTSTSSFAADPLVATFNTNLQALADSRIGEGDKIIVVDMTPALNYVFDTNGPDFLNGDMFDFLHPNASGYRDMSGVWFAALDTFLPQMVEPAITSAAPPNAVINQPYSFTIISNGLPSPEFSLVNSPPSGMIIDANTGEITWTPTELGDQSVTVRVANPAGANENVYTITVTTDPPPNNVPVAVPDSYSNITKGGTLSVLAADGVLINDTDADNDALTAVLVGDVSFGTLILNADGSFTYTHDGSENLSDSFTYKATDGKADSEPVTVSVSLAITPSGGSSSGGGGGCFIGSIN